MKFLPFHFINNRALTGHLVSAITVLIWGTTFIATKVLLRTFSPLEILFIRFSVGYFALWCVYPHRLHLQNRKQELYFVFAGLSGVTLYYLFENIALTFSSASNVGVLVSVAPFFTAILGSIFLQEGKPNVRFFLGLTAAMGGVCLISFQGGDGISFHMTGDFLAVAAAFLWAIYSILSKKIGEFGYPVIANTRRIFFYGILFMLPMLPFADFHVTTAKLLQTTNLLNLIYLSFGACALCFVTWNFAVTCLGSMKTSMYIYAVPVVTAVSSALILHEIPTRRTILGIALTLAGLIVSQKRT